MTDNKECNLTKKEKEYGRNLRNAIITGTPDEEDYQVAQTFWKKIGVFLT